MPIRSSTSLSTADFSSSLAVCIPGVDIDSAPSSAAGSDAGMDREEEVLPAMAESMFLQELD